jgi:hypothetical protein
MDVSASFSGLLGNVTASHIHVINGPGDANQTDTNGPVATTVPSFPGFPLGVTAGTYFRSFDMTAASSYNPFFFNASGGTTANAEAALFSAIQQGRAYFNIHTNLFGGGEIRGFLTPVPEPATAVLFIMSLVAMALNIRIRGRV